MSHYKKSDPRSQRVIDDNSGARDPSSHRTPAQVRKLDRTYNATPEMRRRRGENNKARSMLEKAGRVHKGDHKDVGHLKMLDHGGKTVMSNLAVQSQKKNRGWRRDA